MCFVFLHVFCFLCCVCFSVVVHSFGVLNRCFLIGVFMGVFRSF